MSNYVPESLIEASSRVLRRQRGVLVPNFGEPNQDSTQTPSDSRPTSPEDVAQRWRAAMLKARSKQRGRGGISEAITKKTPVEQVIRDFQKSNAPQFEGKSKNKRRMMALAAYYKKQREKSNKQINEDGTPKDRAKARAERGAPETPKKIGPVTGVPPKIPRPSGTGSRPVVGTQRSVVGTRRPPRINKPRPHMGM